MGKSTNWALSTGLLITALLATSISHKALGGAYVETLEERIGGKEEVNINVYVLGFDHIPRGQVRQAVRRSLRRTKVLDSKPWWIPRKPVYEEQTGATDFATLPAPAGLPSELTPPDGLIRFEPNSLLPDQATLPGFTLWQPNNGIELEDMVANWLANNDVVNNLEHEGSLRDVEFVVNDIEFTFVRKRKLDGLYDALKLSEQSLKLDNPATTFRLFSYNVLLDWLQAQPAIEVPDGGASIVLLNLENFAGQQYAFYAEPNKDLVPVPGQAPATRQYPPVTAANPQNQVAADLFTAALGGAGLDHVKMLSNVELECSDQSTAQAEGLVQQIPGIRPEQAVCAQWRTNVIRNLLGNQGRRFFINDATTTLASQPYAYALDTIAADVRELYRYGVLAQSIKGVHEYTEAQELRTLVVDLRFDATDLCILSQLQQGVEPTAAVGFCAANSSFFPTEKTYSVNDVFDSELALRSLREFAPGRWISNLVPFDFSNLPDPVTIALTKQGLRDALDQPVIDIDPVTPGLQPFAIRNFPFFRELSVQNETGDFVKLTSSYEKALDFQTAVNLIVNEQPNGLGLYDQVWPDAVQVDERPYRETGKPFIHVSFLYLTPPPDGPLGEKWGTFAVDSGAGQLLGVTNEFGGGGFWSSVAGNEMAGGLARRDFSGIAPQYVLGKNRGAGEAQPWVVTPLGGVVQGSGVESTFARRADGGAPHWCNEFNDPDEAKRKVCRDFVRTTTTLQTIETIQHGLGYAHTHEPRIRYHFDGQLSTQQRNNELFADSVLAAQGVIAGDEVGRALHQMVNMYTTLGVSSLWGQSVNDWNGVGPHAGMQATLFRSHVREVAKDLEEQLVYAQEQFYNHFPNDARVYRLLNRAHRRHQRMKNRYQRWSYKDALYSALRGLSALDKALTHMGEPDRIHDPIAELDLQPF